MPDSCAKAFSPTMALLRWTSSPVREETRRGSRHELFGVNAGLEGELVVAGLHRHDDFFEGGIACTLANTVDGTLDLPGSAHHAGDGVGDRQA